MSRQSKKGCKPMKCMKTVKMDNIICPEPKISTKGVAGAAIGAVVGGVCAGKGGAVVGGLVGYAIGKCLEPWKIEDILIH